MAAGALSYQSSASPATSSAERRSRATLKDEPNSASSSATEIVDRYGSVLGLANTPKPKQVAAPVNTDPLAAFKLAGVVEQGGERVAVFTVGEGDNQQMLTLRQGDEAAGKWVVERIGTTSAELSKAGTSRKFMLFE